MKRVGLLSLVLVLAGCQTTEKGHFERVAAELPAARAAAIKAGVPMHSRELAPPALKPEDNAAPLLRQAAAHFRGMKVPSSSDISKLVKANDESSNARAAELLGRADRGIDLIVQATQRPGVNFDRNWDTDQPWNIVFPEYADLRASAKWVTARSLVRARSGDRQAAVSDLSAGFMLGRFAGSEPIIISLLVQIAIDAIATRHLEYVVATNGRDVTLVQSLRDLLAKQGEMRDFWFFLGGEAVMNISLAEQWPTMSDEELRMFGDQPWPTPPLGVSKELAARAYTTRFMEVWSEASNGMKSGEYKRSPNEVLEGIVKKAEGHKDPTYVLSAMFMPIFSQAGDAIVARTARLRAAEGMLAAVAYWQANGKMPDTLEQAGFKALDPFTNKPFRYQAMGDTVTVWSVGKDLKDDGASEGENKDIVAKFPRL